ncbi:MAG: O-methyltransferase [Pseudomonadota bacterium]
MQETKVFEAVDDYIHGLFVEADPVLDDILARSTEAGLPDIQVSPGQGKLLYLLTKMIGASRVLEIGTLGGYSTVWLGRAMSGGELITIEFDEVHAAFASETLERADLKPASEVLCGRALDLLPDLEPHFDVVFLDANKDSYPAYLRHAVRLTRPGGLIIADNVVRDGAVLAPDGVDPQAVGAAAFNQALAEHPALEAIILQQVGIKGHDGLAIARVKDS